MLESMGIPTGVDLKKLVEVVWLLEEILGRQTTGLVSQASPRPEAPEDYHDPSLPLVETHEQARHFLLGPETAEGGQRPWPSPVPAPHLGL